MAELTAEQRAMLRATGWPDSPTTREYAVAIVKELRAAGFAIIPLEPDEEVMTTFGSMMAGICGGMKSEVCTPEDCICREKARAAYSTIAGGADG